MMIKKIEKILEIEEDIDYKKLSIEDILFLKEFIDKLEKKVNMLSLTLNNTNNQLIDLENKLYNDLGEYK